MTARELLEIAGREPAVLLAIFALPPLLALILGLLHGRGLGARSPWKYFYAALVYLACVPGMFAVVLTAYTLFFVRGNLLDVNLAVYALPILSMLATLVLIRRRVSFDAIPGFDRLSGLLLTVAVCFAVALAIEKTRLLVLFGGSIFSMLVIALVLFLLARWGMRTAFGPRRQRVGYVPEDWRERR